MRKVLVLMAAAALAGGLSAGPALAGGLPLSLVGDPAPGATVFVGGEACSESGMFNVGLYHEVSPGVFELVSSGGGLADADGAWSKAFEIPGDAVSGDTYEFGASCTTGGDPVHFNYTPYIFTMGGSTPTTPTITTPPTSEEPTTNPSAAPTSAARAAATGGTPRYTG